MIRLPEQQLSCAEWEGEELNMVSVSIEATVCKEVGPESDNAGAILLIEEYLTRCLLPEETNQALRAPLHNLLLQIRI